MNNYFEEAPEIIKDYLGYMQTIKGKSPKTIDEYYLDLRTFFRYLKREKYSLYDIEFNKISIDDIDLQFVKSVTLKDIYSFMNYTQRDRENIASTRARKTTSIRMFFNYLCNKKGVLEINPAKELELPKKKKTIPKYLTLEQSIDLLKAIDGEYKERDYCIITLFLNCGLRLSELVKLNVTDIKTDHTMRVLGKGNKERIVYLNESCLAAVDNYLRVRPCNNLTDKKALFISRQNNRISPKTVQLMVYNNLKKIGLDDGYSVHKLRHTAATLMYQHGNVDIRVLKDILGHENLGTTQIYTHLSSKQMEDASKANPLSKIDLTDKKK